jgi:hypothetical protein
MPFRLGHNAFFFLTLDDRMTEQKNPVFWLSMTDRARFSDDLFDHG